ncbi:MAG: 30S ribosomal protein S1 [Parachlamydiales bacterium]
MPHKTFTWEDKNFLNNVDFREEELQDFRKLLGVEEEESTSFAPGSLLKGRVVEIAKDFAVIDVGLKSEGLVPVTEFDPADLALGTEVEVLLEATEDEGGQIVLSREKARRQRQWEYILEHCDEGTIITGKILRKVKGGLMVDIGMEAFLPGSQIDSRRIKNLDEFVGKTLDFKILKINIERKNVVVSRREVLEAERLSKKAELLDTMEVGDIRKGVVKNITDFGVFLDLDGIDGLLHITDMTWKRIRHPSEMVELGQELEVMILSIDKEKGRIALGLKQREANPWEEIEARYPPGKRVSGTIVNLVPYGAFIELEEGVEGLIHISEMSWTKNITDPSEIVRKGQHVDAVVLAVQKDEGKISLGMKQVEHNPWEDVQTKYPIGREVDAEVRSLTNYGAFVELEPGVDGLIHISDLSWIKKVSHPSELLAVGDRVKAQILSVDQESKKITLGMKQLTENPWDSIEKDLPPGSIVEGAITKIAAFGAFLELDNGVEALIHVTELSDRPFGKVEEILSVGDRVKAEVLRLDPENKKIAVSTKAFLGDGKGKSDEIDVGGRD